MLDYIAFQLCRFAVDAMVESSDTSLLCKRPGQQLQVVSTDWFHRWKREALADSTRGFFPSPNKHCNMNGTGNGSRVEGVTLPQLLSPAVSLESEIMMLQ